MYLIILLDFLGEFMFLSSQVCLHKNLLKVIYVIEVSLRRMLVWANFLMFSEGRGQLLVRKRFLSFIIRAVLWLWQTSQTFLKMCAHCFDSSLVFGFWFFLCVCGLCLFTVAVVCLAGMH